MIGGQLAEQFGLELERLGREDFVLQQADRLALLGDVDGLHRRPARWDRRGGRGRCIRRRCNRRRAVASGKLAHERGERRAGPLPAFALGHHPLLEFVEAGADQLDAVLGIVQRVAQVEEVDPRIGIEEDVFVGAVGQLRSGGLAAILASSSFSPPSIGL